MEKIVEINNLSLKYPVKKAFSSREDEFIYAVNDVSLDIYKGEILGLVGESGCGKSSLGKCILRLVDNFDGSILFKGKDICADKNLKMYRKAVKMIFQNPYASLNPRMTIYDILKEQFLIYGIKDKDYINSEIERVCDLTGIAKSSLSYYPHEFSGGQRQRISIASSIILNPEFIVADEPVSALDVSIRAQIINLLQDLRKELNLTILFISHDLSVVRYICNRTAVMYLGEIVEISDEKELFENPKHPYTQALLNSVPIISKEQKKKVFLNGELPSPKKPPSGCKFHTRCPKAESCCSFKNPDYYNFENGRVKCHLYNGFENCQI